MNAIRFIIIYLFRRGIMIDRYIIGLLALLLIADISFAHSECQDKRTLQVNGKGEVMIKPDIAFIAISVETDSDSAFSASNENAKKMQRVVKEIKLAIGKDDKISTSGYNLSPRYEYNKSARQSELIGYRASNRLNIETKKIKKLGEIIDKSISAGANKVDSLSFGSSNSDESRRQALANAVKDARKTAQIVADASGVKLLKILTISPSYNYPIPLRRDFAVAGKMAMESAPTQIEAGELTITANVNIVFEIE